jgi:hypothetical protein
MLIHGVTVRIPEGERAARRGFAAKFHDQLMRLEDRVPAGRSAYETLWKAHLRVVEQAVAERNVSAAVRAWHDAYGAALASRSWEGMLAVGDAFLSIGEAAGTPNGARPNARQAYLTALIRARRDRSVDGMLRTAQAFASLGDREVVEQCIRVAEQLAAGDERASQRVHAFGERWAEQLANAQF